MIALIITGILALAALALLGYSLCWIAKDADRRSGMR